MAPIEISSLPSVPWKNGGGSTRTLAVSPEGAGFDDFVWRISVAEVEASGDFSLFPGVDRTILLLEGRGMTLHSCDGSVHALTEAFRPWRMRGDDPVQASLVNGSARDFNVMVRRGKVESAVHVWEAAASVVAPTEDAVFYCPRGSFAVSAIDGEDALIEAGFAQRISCKNQALQIAPASPNAILIGVFLVPAGERKEQQ